MFKKHHNGFKRPVNYWHRNFLFWFVVFAVFIIAVLATFSPQYIKPATIKQESKFNIHAGIYGEVIRPGVYKVPEGSDLAILITRAGGLTSNADIIDLDLEFIISNDSIYHIPSRAVFNDDPVWDSLLLNFEQPGMSHELPFEWVSHEGIVIPELPQLNILYVGIPCTYIIINYFPDHNLVNVMHIPYTTVFFEREVTLQKVFLSMGIQSTMRMIENRLQLNIDHYIIQERFEFSDMINLVNGIWVDVDSEFAESYNLEPGLNHLDGFLSWEYIRYMGQHHTENYNLRKSAYSSPVIRNTAMEKRHHNQRIVISGIQDAFKKLSRTEQAMALNNFRRTVDSDISLGIIEQLYPSLMATPQFSYGTIPGHYGLDNSYYYPDYLTFNQMRRQFVRDYL